MTDFLLPQPDSVGITETKKLYLDKYDKVLSDAEAQEILGRLMRHLFLVNYPPCCNSENTFENPTTTEP